MKTIHVLYGKEGMDLQVPDDTQVLAGKDEPALEEPDRAVAHRLENPIGSPPLRELVRRRDPDTVAVTISDITRPVPNTTFLPGILSALNDAGVDDSQIVLIIGTGMHRPSTPDEREMLLGAIESRVEVVDHTADRPETLVTVSDDPPVRVNRRFVEADFRIVTGLIEPHFMAGFSGGRKGVCPALVDLETVKRFHGYETLANPRADNGVLLDNPCHEIALHVARAVGVDFLFNVSITPDRRLAGIYCGDLEEAHAAGCEEVADWTTARVDKPFDFVLTCGGGFPLDQTFYQTVKGMVGALPALHEESTLLTIAHCGEGLGSQEYHDLMLRWDNDWKSFLKELAGRPDETHKDQWEFQMQAKVLDRIGRERLWFVSDGIDPDTQEHIAVNPMLGSGDAAERAQAAVDEFVSADVYARMAVVPDGPYTMIRRRS
jgi:nickel-dependent lactate racemase